MELPVWKKAEADSNVTKMWTAQLTIQQNEPGDLGVVGTKFVRNGVSFWGTSDL